MAAYYNEIDPYAAQWLRNLIAAGHIAPGVVDTRSIEDIHPVELRGFTQCHFFAGIGAWSLALRRAGWADTRPVWTGSCPCQPFSAAGKGAGFADERHLWPAFHHLIRECRPPAVFGEQVASQDGLQWLNLVRADLEAEGYAVGAADLCAAGVGAPHIRQRLYWVADPNDRGERLVGNGGASVVVGQANDASLGPGRSGATGRLAHADHARLEGRGAVRQRADQCVAGPGCLAGGVADAECSGVRGQPGNVNSAQAGAGHREHLHHPVSGGDDVRTSPLHGQWAAADWLACRDGRWRPVEPGAFPLAHGATGRVGRLRAYGNAIVPQVAETFISSYLNT